MANRFCETLVVITTSALMKSVIAKQNGFRPDAAICRHGTIFYQHEYFMRRTFPNHREPPCRQWGGRHTLTSSTRELVVEDQFTLFFRGREYSQYRFKFCPPFKMQELQVLFDPESVVLSWLPKRYHNFLSPGYVYVSFFAEYH